MSYRKEVGFDRYNHFLQVGIAASLSQKPRVARELERIQLRVRDRLTLSPDKILFGGSHLLLQLSDIARLEINSGRYGIYFPWLAEAEMDLAKISEVTIAFTNDHQVPIPKDFTPRDQVVEVVEKWKSEGAWGDLGLPELIKLSSVTDNFWANLYIGGLAAREVSRGNDDCLGISPLTTNERKRMLLRLQMFPSDKTKECGIKWLSENAGDWYHFMSMASLVTAVESHKLDLCDQGKLDASYRLKFLGLESLLGISAEVTRLTRGSKLGSGDHCYADSLGRRAGRFLAQVFRTNSSG